MAAGGRHLLQHALVGGAHAVTAGAGGRGKRPEGGSCQTHEVGQMLEGKDQELSVDFTTR